MELVSYQKKLKKLLNSNNNKLWFGTSGSFTRSETPLFQDNSFRKYDYVKNQNDRRLQTVNKAYNNAKTELEGLRGNLYFSHIKKQQLLAVFRRKAAKRKLIILSAIKIQKCIRGFLTRKKYNNVFFS